jgi:hypothetical protein
MGLSRVRSDADTGLFWSHVAAFGALWGSIEITLGSFLHALRFPFAGVLLASLGAALLVAARQVQPDRGLSLATGVVAALCKSISPGGVILGPMIGIATEGLLVELALLVAPQHLLCAAMAGGVCALWATFQKVISQIIFYGAGVIALYLAALRHARAWLGLPPSAGWWALGALLAAVLLVGCGAALVGRQIGRAARNRLAAAEEGAREL